jgi:hypothetical protein
VSGKSHSGRVKRGPKQSTNHRAEKVGAAASRLLASSTSRIQSGDCWPWPMVTKQPMMLRIMWCKKALPSNSKRQRRRAGDVDVDRQVLMGDSAWQLLARKDEKSCSPSRCWLAFCMGFRPVGGTPNPRGLFPGWGARWSRAPHRHSACRWRWRGSENCRASLAPIARRCRGQIPVGATNPRMGVAIEFGVKVHHLHEAMHTCIGAACTQGADPRYIGKFGQGFFELVLDGQTRALALPALVSRAGVTNAKGESHWLCPGVWLA